MQYSAFKKQRSKNLPPNLDVGTSLQKITGFTPSNFQLNGKDTKGMQVHAVDASGTTKTYRTSSGVIMNQIEEFFKAHPNETIDNVKVIQPRGKQYLTLEEA